MWGRFSLNTQQNYQFSDWKQKSFKYSKYAERVEPKLSFLRTNLKAATQDVVGKSRNLKLSKVTMLYCLDSMNTYFSLLASVSHSYLL